jgi:hypothetical protein
MYKLHKLKDKTHHNIAHKEARIKTSNKKLYKPLQSLATTAQLCGEVCYRQSTENTIFQNGLTDASNNNLSQLMDKRLISF